MLLIQPGAGGREGSQDVDFIRFGGGEIGFRLKTDRAIKLHFMHVNTIIFRNEIFIPAAGHAPLVRWSS